MQSIGSYIIEYEIGGGGTSTVYLARNPESNQQVAVKLLSEELSNDKSARARFEREAKILNDLDHPSIVPILDFGEEDGRLFVVMPYLSKGSVWQTLQNGPLLFDTALGIIQPVAAALDAAHAENVIHRDVKPQNILLGDFGDVCLSDFGVARYVNPDAPEQTVTLIGTPEFMAPEQASHGRISPQTDVYQLGVTVYQMLTGQRPFTGSTLQVIAEHLTKPVPSAEEINPLLPGGTDWVLRQALAKNPDDRFQTAGAFYQALQGLTQVEPSTIVLDSESIAELAGSGEPDAEPIAVSEPLGSLPVAPIPQPTPARRPPFKWVGRLALAGVVLALIAGGFFVVPLFDGPGGGGGGNGGGGNGGGNGRGGGNGGGGNGAATAITEVVEAGILNIPLVENLVDQTGAANETVEFAEEDALTVLPVATRDEPDTTTRALDPEPEFVEVVEVVTTDRVAQPAVEPEVEDLSVEVVVDEPINNRPPANRPDQSANDNNNEGDRDNDGPRNRNRNGGGNGN